MGRKNSVPRVVQISHLWHENSHPGLITDKLRWWWQDTLLVYSTNPSHKINEKHVSRKIIKRKDGKGILNSWAGWGEEQDTRIITLHLKWFSDSRLVEILLTI